MHAHTNVPENVDFSFDVYRCLQITREKKKGRRHTNETEVTVTITNLLNRFGSRLLPFHSRLK